MKNHFHLVIETPEANLIEGMRWLQSTYTIRLNQRHKLFGHVFSGRYKALMVDGSGEGYLKTVCDYVHSQARAERMIAEELAALGWKEWELSSRRKNDPAKLALAARLRRETTWTPKQIATRLSIGTPKSATTALHRWMQNNPQALMESGALRRETGKWIASP